MSMKTKDTNRSSKSRGKPAPWQRADHEFADEQTRYADPIPSRNLILQTLTEQQGPMTLDELIGQFALGKLTQQEALGKRLQAMVRDGQLLLNRRGA